MGRPTGKYYGLEVDFPSSQLARVSGGNVEYSSVGDGPTILISHGTLGGFDQALAIAQLFDQQKFKFLAVSRAGYLRSSPETGRTPREQAVSYHELLDHEGIASAAVMGVSGGSSSALRFAQDFPDRCWGVVLISSVATALPPLPLFFRLTIRMQGFTMRIDPLWSLVYQYGLGLIMRSNGLRPGQIRQVFRDAHRLSAVRGIFQSLHSLSSRREGFLLDDAQINSLPVEPNYHIRVPTLISHAANDPMAPAEAAARMAKSIPGAEYLEYQDGGHLFFVVHSHRAVPRIERFLLANFPG